MMADLPEEMAAGGYYWLGGSLHADVALVFLLHLNKIL
jgi:hypothetical protein